MFINELIYICDTLYTRDIEHVYMSTFVYCVHIWLLGLLVRGMRSQMTGPADEFI